MFVLELYCFFNNPSDAGNLISGSSAFSKTSLNLWKFLVQVLLKPGLENFEHYFTSMWSEHNCAVVWGFFGTAFLKDWKEKKNYWRKSRKNTSREVGLTLEWWSMEVFKRGLLCIHLCGCGLTVLIDICKLHNNQLYWTYLSHNSVCYNHMFVCITYLWTLKGLLAA